MGRFYSDSRTAAAQTAAQDLIQLLAASNVHVIIHKITVTSDLTTDERNIILLHRGTAAGGNAGNGEAQRVTGDAAADSTVTFHDTTQNTPANILEEHEWSCLLPWETQWTPEERVHVPGGGSFTVELGEAITSTSIACTIVWEELG